jgi:hypothetical protein
LSSGAIKALLFLGGRKTPVVLFAVERDAAGTPAEQAA